MIKKIALIFILISTLLNATNLDTMLKLYKDKNYEQVCLIAGDLYKQNRSNEKFLDIYAHSCLEVDMINKTIFPIIKLYRTAQSRENAAYFSTILYKKKLLYHALIDDVDISYINLPKTNYILSNIFDKFVNGEYEHRDGVYWFKDSSENSLNYKLSIESNNGIKKLFLRTYW